MTNENEIWSRQIHDELTQNILPFWTNKVRDPNGGFFGAVDCDGRIQTDAERSAVLNTRILWTFSTATRLFGLAYRPTADWAFRYLSERFVDQTHGGVYWMLDANGRTLSPRKQIYAQAFAIYAFAEYARATGSRESLQQAISLYRKIEEFGYEPAHQGYIEALDEEWRPLADMRLSEKDLNSPKSMNTHLHILEAYTNLLRVWRDPQLLAKQTELLNVVLNRVVDGKTFHFKLFFDNGWGALNDHVSYGHDIEGSWLLTEAAEVLGDEGLQKRTITLALAMAQTVYAEGRDRDGSLFYEADGNGNLTDPKKHWWAQAEAMVGFYNAFQLTKDARFEAASRAVWDYITAKIVDRVHGEWHAKLSPDGRPLTLAEDSDAGLAGPWKCPYHNARACFEMLHRLGAIR